MSNNQPWALWDLSPTDARYEYQLMHEGKFTEIHHIKSMEYLLTTPPKSALDKLAEITDLCLAREIPSDRIRLVWWELGGSDAGWYFDWQGWRGKSYKQEKSKRESKLRDPYRTAPRELAHVRDVALPEASSAWAHLTPDEASSTGYGDSIDPTLDYDKQPRSVRVELWKEELYPAHVLEAKAIPAWAQLQHHERGRAFGEIACTHCKASVWFTESTWSDQVQPAILGTRDSPNEQVFLSEFFLRGKDPRFSTGELNRNRERVRGLFTQPFRENHPLACKKGRVP